MTPKLNTIELVGETARKYSVEIRNRSFTNRHERSKPRSTMERDQNGSARSRQIYRHTYTHAATEA